MTEFQTKLERVYALLGAHKLDALLLTRLGSFAWATCGGSAFVNTATADSVASLLVTREHRYVITTNIEAPRLEKEELPPEQGWELCVANWWEPNSYIAELTQGLRVGSDAPCLGALNLANEMARVRANLLPEEGARFRALGKLCAEGMEAAIRAVRPGQSEFEIAARLGQEVQARGAQPIVNLIATDERIFNFRHPIPIAKKMERYAMLVLCGRKSGLVCSITRLVHFGRMSDELRRKTQACAMVDATLIAATRPGARLKDIFQRGVEAYAAAGYPDEWKRHHQGGPVGYEPRAYLGTPTSTDVVNVGQAYAWNPSIAGCKSEDTFLVGENGNEVLTEIPGWPMLTVTQVQGEPMLRPAVLEVL